MIEFRSFPARLAFVASFLLCACVLVGWPVYRLASPLTCAERSEIRMAAHKAKAHAAQVKAIYAINRR